MKNVVRTTKKDVNNVRKSDVCNIQITLYDSVKNVVNKVSKDYHAFIMCAI